MRCVELTGRERESRKTMEIDRLAVHSVRAGSWAGKALAAPHVASIDASTFAADHPVDSGADGQPATLRPPPSEGHIPDGRCRSGVRTVLADLALASAGREVALGQLDLGRRARRADVGQQREDMVRARRSARLPALGELRHSGDDPRHHLGLALKMALVLLAEVAVPA
jgi:hypothetical protein